MREYSRVAPQFWTGKTGKKIREGGRDVQVVALYVISCPSANVLGLYYLPLPTLCHEIGCSLQGASKALLRLSEVGFAHYDEVSEHVWVPEMARFQLGKALASSDKRIPWLKKQLQALRSTPFFNAFLEKYAKVYHLGDVSPSEGASVPLRRGISLEQEQDQEQEKEHEQEGGGEGPSAPARDAARKSRSNGGGNPDEVERLSAAWNQEAAASRRDGLLGLVPCRKVTPALRTHAEARLREEGLEFHRVTIAKAGRSKFLCGGGPRGWRADFRFYVRAPDHPQEIAAGKYDDQPTSRQRLMQELLGTDTAGQAQAEEVIDVEATPVQ